MGRDWAIVDGVGMPLAEASWPATDPAVLRGWSVFETVRSEDGGALHQLDEHLARLEKSCHATGIPVPDRGKVAEEMRAAAREVAGRARVRLTLSGSGRRVVTAEALDPDRLHRPIHAARGRWRDEPYLRGFVKHSSRAPWIAAVQRSGVDEVLLVDAAGRFTEGTTCAILAVLDGVLWTAPHDGRILESTTCLEVLERAERLGISVNREGPPADGPWEGLYVASTTRDLAPVCSLDGVALPAWEPVGLALARQGGGFVGPEG